MIEQYCIYEKNLPNEVFEIIPSLVEVTEKCPFFVFSGNVFPCDTYGVRKMTEREIKKHVLVKPNENHTQRKNLEYTKWKEQNDLSDKNGEEYFYVNNKKFYTINREEFKTLVEKSKSEGKHNFEYRGRMFSVYHFY